MFCQMIMLVGRMLSARLKSVTVNTFATLSENERSAKPRANLLPDLNFQLESMNDQVFPGPLCSSTFLTKLPENYGKDLCMIW